MLVGMKRRIFRLLPAILLILLVPVLPALETQPAAIYHARRAALAAELKGGVAVLFSAPEPLLDFDPYRQDSDFFYLTGWNEPDAALVVVAARQTEPQRAYQEILFLPTRDLRMEKYTGQKLDAATPDAARLTGVDAVRPMTELPAVLNSLVDRDRSLLRRLWTEPGSQSAQALLSFLGSTLGVATTPAAHDVSEPVANLRAVKDAGEIELMKKASAASIAGQRVLFHAVKTGATERAVAGAMIAAWMAAGCERPSYAPIVGSGPNSTVLHYSANDRTMHQGELVVADAACEYSMYASDITRTVPVGGHFTPRQREIYNIVLGAQQAAVDAFVAGKSKLNDRDRQDPDSLDQAAYNYINTHGKSLTGEPLGKYWLHGLGHLVGLDVHDPTQYPVVLKPGMVFTIEPGVYIPEENLGVRLECTFLVGTDGKLIDLTAGLPHTAEDVEAAMRAE
jgi:Xaa-Pro aminopeptidase